MSGVIKRRDLLLVAALFLPADLIAAPPRDSMGSIFPVSSDEECWRRLPPAEKGGGQTLPTWARAMAGAMPRTTAAMLRLDYLHRTRNPLGPELRGKMRWVAGRANDCEYSMACAEADL